jgi:hypothetical protein
MRSSRTPLCAKSRNMQRSKNASLFDQFVGFTPAALVDDCRHGDRDEDNP